MLQRPRLPRTLLQRQFAYVSLHMHTLKVHSEVIYRRHTYELNFPLWVEQRCTCNKIVLSVWYKVCVWTWHSSDIRLVQGNGPRKSPALWERTKRYVVRKTFSLFAAPECFFRVGFDVTLLCMFGWEIVRKVHIAHWDTADVSAPLTKSVTHRMETHHVQQMLVWTHGVRSVWVTVFS